MCTYLNLFLAISVQSGLVLHQASATLQPSVTVCFHVDRWRPSQKEDKAQLHFIHCTTWWGKVNSQFPFHQWKSLPPEAVTRLLYKAPMICKNRCVLSATEGGPLGHEQYHLCTCFYHRNTAFG